MMVAWTKAAVFGLASLQLALLVLLVLLVLSALSALSALLASPLLLSGPLAAALVLGSAPPSWFPCPPPGATRRYGVARPCAVSGLGGTTRSQVTCCWGWLF